MKKLFTTLLITAAAFSASAGADWQYTSMPVKHDLTLELANATKPNADGEISANKQINSFFFMSTVSGLGAVSTRTPNVTIKSDSEDNTFEASGVLKKSFGLNADFTYFTVDFQKEPKYNGDYTVTIAADSFGDAEWLADHNFGRTNDEVVLHFTLVDGLSNVALDVEPTVTPAAGAYQSGADFATVTVIVADGIEAAEGARALLGGIDVVYNAEATFQLQDDGSYIATFSPVPSENGEYQLMIPMGQFGDAEYLATQASGHTNDDIIVEYTLSNTESHISVVEMERSKSNVYDLHGIRFDENFDNLPNGIYIKSGKKVKK